MSGFEEIENKARAHLGFSGFASFLPFFFFSISNLL